jgi:MoxR-like ATPase
LEWRDFVIPEDIKEVAVSTLAHRLVLNYDAVADSISWEQIIQEIINSITIS